MQNGSGSAAATGIDVIVATIIDATAATGIDATAAIGIDATAAIGIDATAATGIDATAATIIDAKLAAAIADEKKAAAAHLEFAAAAGTARKKASEAAATINEKRIEIEDLKRKKYLSLLPPEAELNRKADDLDAQIDAVRLSAEPTFAEAKRFERLLIDLADERMVIRSKLQLYCKHELKTEYGGQDDVACTSCIKCGKYY